MEFKRNILITGGAGFIGSHVVRLFVNKYADYHIVNLDKLTYAGNLANLKDIEDKPNYTFVRADICDFEKMLELMRQYHIDGIIHLAAESHVDRSIKDPFTFARTNVMGIVNSVNEIVETSETAQNALSTWKETSKIFEQGREYYDKLRKVNDLISGSEKVKESVLMLGDISEIYVNNFGKMLTDKNFSQRELNAIAAGYNTIMKKSSRSITELKNIINPTGMSMNDKERIDLVNRVYREMTHYKELANYYTRKNLHVSYLRAKEKNEQQQVFDLYGKDERYW